MLGATPSLVSTVLQGVYQSNQATAAAVQVNNLHLIVDSSASRGLIGKPGSTVFQMNGQPTAQNTRECGANGEMVAFRNWQNPQHVARCPRGGARRCSRCDGRSKSRSVSLHAAWRTVPPVGAPTIRESSQGGRVADPKPRSVQPASGRPHR